MEKHKELLNRLGNEMFERVKKFVDIITEDVTEENPYAVIREIHGERIRRFHKLDADYLLSHGIKMDDVEYILRVGFDLASQQASPPEEEDESMAIYDIEELNEYGGVFCRINDKVEFMESDTSGVMGAGVDLSDVINKCRKMGGEVIAELHTHPFGDLVPSEADMESALKDKVPITCIAAKVRDDAEGLEEGGKKIFRRTKLGVTCYRPSSPPISLFTSFKSSLARNYKHVDFTYSIASYPTEEELREYAKEEGVNVEDEEEFQEWLDEFWSTYEPEYEYITAPTVLEEDIEEYNEEGKKTYDVIIDATKELVSGRVWIPKDSEP